MAPLNSYERDIEETNNHEESLNFDKPLNVVEVNEPPKKKKNAKHFRMNIQSNGIVSSNLKILTLLTAPRVISFSVKHSGRGDCQKGVLSQSDLVRKFVTVNNEL